MTWAKLDDQMSHAPEWIGIAEQALRIAAKDRLDEPPTVIAEAARQLAQRAKALHLLALQWSVPALTDGRLSTAAVSPICSNGSFSETEFYEAAEVLVAAKAWRRIRATPRDPLGGFEMLLGWAAGEQPTREEDRRRRARARLRGRLRVGGPDYPKKLAAIKRSAGHCEYCDTKLGEVGGQVDHVDPAVETNDLDNIAWCCASCNKLKGEHTLKDVGMSFTKRALAARAAWSRTQKTSKDQAK